MKKLLLLFAAVVLVSCKSSYLSAKKSAVLLDINQEKDDNAFVNLKNYSNDFVFDMKYATADNFLKNKFIHATSVFSRLKP
jgi:D-alanyl-D-alanine dipeptidase